MAYTLDGSDSTAAYTTANTLYCPEAWQVDFTVNAFSIAYQFQAYDPNSPAAQGGSLWLPEEFMFVPAVAAGTGTPLVMAGMSRRVAGIRIRTLVAGNLATFQAILVPPNELPPQTNIGTTGNGYPAYSGSRNGGAYKDPIPSRILG
jgi:hypothetical protein